MPKCLNADHMRISVTTSKLILELFIDEEVDRMTHSVTMDDTLRLHESDPRTIQ